MYKLYRLADKGAKTLAVVAIICVFLQAVLDIAQAISLTLVLEQIKNWNKPEFDNTQYWIFTSTIFIFALFSLLFGAIGSYLGSKSSLMIAKVIRHNMFENVQTLSFIDIDKATTSSLITRITNDVQKYQMAILLVLTLLIKAPIMFIGGMAIAFVVNWAMGVMVICVMLVMSITLILICKKGVPYFDKAQVDTDNLNAVLRENVLGMRVVKTFCLEEQQQKRFAKLNKELKVSNTKGWVAFSLLIPAINISVNLAMVLAYLIGGQLGLQPQLIYLVVNIVMLVLSSIIIAAQIVITVAKTSPSVKRIWQIFDLRPSIKNEPKCVKLNDKEKLDIEFKNVNFKYINSAGECVLSNINLKIKHGQMVGIIGGTGSGKTSLVGLIPRLYDLTSGSVTIAGKEIKQIDLDSLRSKVGIVLQENILFSGTIKSNLLYGKQNATSDEIEDAASIACASEFINEDFKKYNAVVEQRGRNFSGGQRQRLSIARTLVKKPQILIMDDSTSALDMATEATLQKNIKKEMKGITTIVVAQRISSVKDCDNIIVMDKGKIVGQGNHKELSKNNNIYKSIVISQLGNEGLR